MDSVTTQPIPSSPQPQTDLKAILSVVYVWRIATGASSYDSTPIFREGVKSLYTLSSKIKCHFDRFDMCQNGSLGGYGFGEFGLSTYPYSTQSCTASQFYSRLLFSGFFGVIVSVMVEVVDRSNSVHSHYPYHRPQGWLRLGGKRSQSSVFVLTCVIIFRLKLTSRQVSEMTGKTAQQKQKNAYDWERVTVECPHCRHVFNTDLRLDRIRSNILNGAKHTMLQVVCRNSECRASPNSNYNPSTRGKPTKHRYPQAKFSAHSRARSCIWGSVPRTSGRNRLRNLERAVEAVNMQRAIDGKPPSKAEYRKAWRVETNTRLETNEIYPIRRWQGLIE